ncbi:hypothetical protein F2P81_005299 [Scophthalmus maximus]|uniref:Uncharacterized protein n=1 Tax=Scophthalmus maximus TaxID=52904 RepID=A0A6A4T635_SCOMX|nr:hypothetical protein F2P81_005299 [Scophthalmus maximus]
MRHRGATKHYYNLAASTLKRRLALSVLLCGIGNLMNRYDYDCCFVTSPDVVTETRPITYAEYFTTVSLSQRSF